MFIFALVVLILIALLFVNVPLIKKKKINKDTLITSRESVNLEATRQKISDIEDEVVNDLIAQDQLGAIRTEAENTLLMEMQLGEKSAINKKSPRFHRFTAAGLSLFIPAVALLVYLTVGSPGALVQTVEEPSQPSMDQMVSKLEQRLADNPGDEEGWLVLAQTNMVMQRFDKAVAAMDKLYQLVGDSPDIMARYADALTMANEGRFTDKASELVKNALAQDPDHVHALWLAGIDAFQSENYASALKSFNKARVNIVDPENLAQIDGLIKTAQEKSGVEMQPQPQPPASPATNAIKVSVVVSANLKDKIKADQTLFVFAKAATGPPMPLAVSRHLASELPLEVSLDDSMAMMQTLKLSTFDQVIISARISESGQPIAQTGDLQGESAIINPKNINEVEITINQIVE